MSDFQPAFLAKFRFVENRNRKSDKSPEKNIVVDFTAEEAVKAANYLMTMAENAEASGNKIRVYTGPDQFDEVAGFSLWGGLWGDRGSFSPAKPETPNTIF